MLTVIINYKLNSQAITLKNHLGKFADVIAIDSGSGLTLREKAHFDISLDNVFYCGMLNAIGQYLKNCSVRYEFVYIVASDVNIDDYEKFVNRVKQTFENPKIGIYGPSVNKNGSPHPQMINKNTGEIRKALFIDGYCFAVRTDILLELLPIDTLVNNIGWGVDIYFSYLASKKGLITVVDDQVIVEHKPSENQEFRNRARNQRNAWYKLLDKKARLYRSLTAIEFLKNEFGATMINSLPWK